MKLTDDEKSAIRAYIRADREASYLARYAVCGGMTYVPGACSTPKAAERLRHLYQLSLRARRFRWRHLERERHAKTALAETHGYRPEYV